MSYNLISSSTVSSSNMTGSCGCESTSTSSNSPPEATSKQQQSILISTNQPQTQNFTTFTGGRNVQSVTFDNIPPSSSVTTATNTINNNSSLKSSLLKSAQATIPQPPLIPPPSLTHSATAYLVQTVDGSTLLIQPQSITNSAHHLLQMSQQNTQPQTNNQNNLTLNRNPYNLTIPLHCLQQQQQSTSNTNTLFSQAQNFLSNSSSVNSPSIIERPESAVSNVYQTIDADR